jgi:hypothetical protein
MNTLHQLRAMGVFPASHTDTHKSRKRFDGRKQRMYFLWKKTEFAYQACDNKYYQIPVCIENNLILLITCTRSTSVTT